MHAVFLRASENCHKTYACSIICWLRSALLFFINRQSNYFQQIHQDMRYLRPNPNTNPFLNMMMEQVRLGSSLYGRWWIVLQSKAKLRKTCMFFIIFPKNDSYWSYSAQFSYTDDFRIMAYIVIQKAHQRIHLREIKKGNCLFPR